MSEGQASGEGDDAPEEISDWIARVDEALRRGEPPPGFSGEVPAGPDPIDPERMRGLLEWMHCAPWLVEADTTRSGDGNPSTLSGFPEDDDLQIPRAIGRFQPEEVLGRGGFGVVFRAFDPEMGRFVALKIPRVDASLAPEVRRRFLREARAAARFDHPNLVPVFEAGEAGAVCYIASAYCEGPTLRRWIDRGNTPLDPWPAARMAHALARAIEYMHDRGILHCDLKPGNILLDLPLEPGVDPIPRITDFGLARLIEAPTGDSTAAKAWGTPPYMAPEQITQRREAIGAQTDIYALGAILYELLTDAPPHHSSNLWELLNAVTSVPPVPPRKRRRSIPRDLDAIVLKCLEKRPERRYESAKDLADDLQRFLDHHPTHARPLDPIRRSGRWTLRHPAAAVSLVATVVMAMLIVGYLLILVRMNVQLARARDAAQAALERERRSLYAATLALTQEDIRQNRFGPAQARLRELIPPPGSDDPDLRDFAWNFLDRQARSTRTILDDLGPGDEGWVQAVPGLLLANNVQTAGSWHLPPVEAPGAPMLGAARPELIYRGAVRHSGLSELGDMGSLSPDGSLAAFVTGVGQSADELTIVDVETGQRLGSVSWPEHQPLQWPQFAPDGTTLAIGFGPERRPDPSDVLDRKQITLDSGKQLLVLGIPGSPKRHAFSPDGRSLMTIGLANLAWGGVLTIWDVPTGRMRERHQAPFASLAVSPAPGGPIATGMMGGLIQLRDPKRGVVTSEWIADEEAILSLAFSPDGRLLVAGANRVATLWEVESLKCLATLKDLGGRVQSACFLPGTPDIALGTSMGQVEIWHREPLDEPIVLKGHTDEVWGIDFSRDGRWLASVAGDRRVILWDARTGALVKTLEGHDEWPSALVFHPDCRRVITADFGGTIRVWDIQSGQLDHAFSAHPNRIRALAVSPDGRVLATGGRDDALHLWDTTTWSLLEARPNPHDGQIRALTFTPDGQTFASAGDFDIGLWDTGSNRLRERWKTTTHVTCLAFSPDARLIASGDNRGIVTIRNTVDGTIRTALPALHDEEISTLRFSPDGRVLAVGGQDASVTLIDVATGRHHLTLSGHSRGINALAFSPDGRTLATASHDHTVRLWWAGTGPPLNGSSLVEPAPRPVPR